MLDTIIRDSKLPPRYAIIWLHGLGASGDDFVPVADQIHEMTPLPIRFIFPHARLRPVTLNGGYVMRAWYDIYGLDANTREDHLGLQETALAICQLIQAQIATGMDARHVFLGGFSQGGAMALYTGLRYDQRLAGIVAFSSYLPMREKIAQIAQKAHPENQHIPVLITHGSEDVVVPMAWGRLSYEALQILGYPVMWKTYAMGHQVCMPQLQDFVRWLNQVVN